MSGTVTSEQLCGAFKARALFYTAIYKEMAEEFGAEKAEELMRKAVYKRGVATGQQFKKFAPADLKGLRDAFLAFIPDSDNTFKPEVVRCDDQELEIKFHGCPLKDGWFESGMSADEVAHMCSMAAIVDNGTFEGAGFEFSSETYYQGQDGCCHLFIRPGKGA